MEHWNEIEDFPGYEVSDTGRVRNRSGHILATGLNGHGTLQVIMFRDGRNHARGVAKLVATYFLDPPPWDQKYAVIQVDGDHRNCSADNLEWKPYWFANRRTRQANQTVPRDSRRVHCVNTGVVYENALECAKEIGGLEDLVILTAQNQHGATYLGRAFQFLMD